MSMIDGVQARLRRLLRRRTVEHELEEEIAFHLERDAEQSMGEGMDGAASRRAARLRFGSGERFREEVRDVWTSRAFRGLGQDLKHSVRRLARRPGFTLIALLTLGLGIGANTAVFSLVRSILMKPMPYAMPERLVMVWNAGGDQRDDTWTSMREVLEYRAATTSFEQLAAYTDFSANVVEGEPERVLGGSVTANTFATLGVAPLHGRTFGEEEREPGRDAVVVLGHGLWQRQFGGAADVVGRTIRVNGVARVVLGVMPPEFRLPMDYREARPTELWIPDVVAPGAELPWGDRSYFIFARLRPGVSVARATADLNQAMEQWIAQGFLDERDEGLDRAAFPLNALLLRDVRPALMVLFGAVALLLLIACANVAHLMLARADARRRELATQAALGGGRYRILRQLLVEGAVLAVLGGAAGVVFANAALGAALALTPVNVIRMRGVSLDANVLLFTLLLAVVTTLLTAMAPAFELARANPASALAAGRGEGARMRRGVRRALVAAETALSVVLVIGGVLLARSFAELRRIDLGFRSESVMTMRVDLPAASYASPPSRAVAFFRELQQRIEAMPDVRGVGATRILPLSGTIGDWTITIEGREMRPGENPNGDWQVVTPGYFEAMGIEIVRGRALRPGDHEEAPLVVVVNETMAERYWPGQDAIGQRFHLGTAQQPWLEIVGIARPVRHNAVIEDARAEMYVAHAQWVPAKNGGNPALGMHLAVRTAREGSAIAAAVREQIRAMDATLPVSDVRTLDAVVSHALAEPRFTTTLIGLFAALALGLAALGLYGVVSFMAVSRTQEMGIRLALGATRARVAGPVLKEGLGMAAIGTAVGVLAAAFLTRLLTSQLYRITALDPLTFLAVPAVLLVVAALASWLPARRASRTSPLVALRAE
jgi:predicted permease